MKKLRARSKKMHRVNVHLHELFQALSDPFRIRIVRLMQEVKGELCLCELSEALSEPEYKLSRHVKILRNHGLITSVRDGKWIYHSLVKDQKFLKTIFKALTEFPDADKQLLQDMAQFQKRLKLRERGRCKVPSKVADTLEKNI
jgi:ArsR family transcriptional regulator, arsenate/arsenite/antimonite-responsive transcriptional repressor